MPGVLIFLCLIFGVLGAGYFWVFAGSIDKGSLEAELYKTTYQFILLALLGGAGSQFYKSMQQKRADDAESIREKRESATRKFELEKQKLAERNELDRLSEEAIRGKKNDRNRLLASQLYEAYGGFFMAWKMWNYHKTWSDYERNEPIDIDVSALFERVSYAEGVLESLLVNLSSSIILTEDQIEDLGRLRQAFQQLRERMQDDAAIPWFSSDDERYKEFKRLVTSFGTLLSSNDNPKQPSPDQAQAAWESITSNSHEAFWDE